MDYVHSCYNVQTYLKTYGNVLGPINGRDMWPSSGHQILLPPDVKKRAGRPKKVRRREPDEDVPDPKQTTLSKKGVKMSCSVCKKLGHNKRGCKQGSTNAGGEANLSGVANAAGGPLGGEANAASGPSFNVSV